MFKLVFASSLLLSTIASAGTQTYYCQLARHYIFEGDIMQIEKSQAVEVAVDGSAIAVPISATEPTHYFDVRIYDAGQKNGQDYIDMFGRYTFNLRVRNQAQDSKASTYLYTTVRTTELNRVVIISSAPGKADPKTAQYSLRCELKK